MSTMPLQKEKQHVMFQFEAGMSADVTIHVRPFKDPTHKGISTRITYESEEDKTYDKIVGELTKTAGLIIQSNFSDGKDDMNTPDELVNQLVLLKALTYSVFHDKGQKDTFSLLARAKNQMFTTTEDIKRLTEGQRFKLTEILRWHLEDAINNPPPLVKR